MPSFEHERLVERIKHLDELPENNAEYQEWIKADRHLDLLRDDAKAGELIIHGSGNYSFICSVLVSEDNVSPLDQDDLLCWNTDSTASLARYNWEMGKEEVWIERNELSLSCKTLENAKRLVFGRHFDGLQAKDSSYLEVLQEYVHLNEIHWRAEQRAYCCFDKYGDFDHIVSVSSHQNTIDVNLVSFKREQLELYLAASKAVLIRMFDFTLFNQGNFNGWPEGDEEKIIESDSFFYFQKVIDGHAGYTRGVQIIRPSRSKTEMFASYTEQWSGHAETEYVEFIAQDLRNEQITKISTDPEATTNYFQAQWNSLPFELSPVFFRPEVLQKYKTDSDKYTVRERDIHCRGAWMLRRYDVNDAGQVHAYICDLRSLPYQEQLYWLSFNEEPKTVISERAFQNDFKGAWTAHPSPLVDVVSIARRWSESGCTWWKLREEALLERVNIPLTGSRDEWASAFGLLANLVIEGFQIRPIRARLKETNIAFGEGDKSLALLEKFLIGHDKLDDGQKLEGLRIVQRIRNIGSSAHPRDRTASDLANDALKGHCTFASHFESVCRTVKSELELIENVLS